MATISIHGLDQNVEQELKELAEQQNQSMDRTIKDILVRALGLTSRRGGNRARFERFCGRWSEQDYAEFVSATEDFSRIDEKDWS